jgi:hypothetical protein
MEISLKPNEEIHVSGECCEPFFDILAPVSAMALAIDFYPNIYHVELREKGGAVRFFCFSSKSEIEELEPAWWTDSRVVWSQGPGGGERIMANQEPMPEISELAGQIQRLTASLDAPDISLDDQVYRSQAICDLAENLFEQFVERRALQEKKK